MVTVGLENVDIGESFGEAQQPLRCREDLIATPREQGRVPATNAGWIESPGPTFPDLYSLDPPSQTRCLTPAVVRPLAGMTLTRGSS